MPKKRKKTKKRKVNKKITILCEGAKDKSESAYFKALKNDCFFANNELEVIIHDTKKNTGKELVNEGKKLIDKQYKDIDEIWIVYDKDGYTKHPDTFDLAYKSGLKIAFSSISFETWILLHFKYTTKCFNCSSDIIKYLDKNFNFKYTKGSKDIYFKTKQFINKAVINSKKINNYSKQASPNKRKYELNPYTDVYKLIENLFKYNQKTDSGISTK